MKTFKKKKKFIIYNLFCGNMVGQMGVWMSEGTFSLRIWNAQAGIHKFTHCLKTRMFTQTRVHYNV